MVMVLTDDARETFLIFLFSCMYSLLLCFDVFQPAGKLGMSSDSTSVIPSTYPSSGVKCENHQDLVGEPGVNQPTSFYNYYYPGLCMMLESA